MTGVKKSILAALVALALAAGGAASVPSQQQAGDPSQVAVYKKGSFDITEAEQVAGSAGERSKTVGRESA